MQIFFDAGRLHVAVPYHPVVVDRLKALGYTFVPGYKVWTHKQWMTNQILFAAVDAIRDCVRSHLYYTDLEPTIECIDGVWKDSRDVPDFLGVSMFYKNNGQSSPTYHYQPSSSSNLLPTIVRIPFKGLLKGADDSSGLRYNVEVTRKYEMEVGLVYRTNALKQNGWIDLSHLDAVQMVERLAGHGFSFEKPSLNLSGLEKKIEKKIEKKTEKSKSALIVASGPADLSQQSAFVTVDAGIWAVLSGGDAAGLTGQQISTLRQMHERLMHFFRLELKDVPDEIECIEISDVPYDG